MRNEKHGIPSESRPLFSAFEPLMVIDHPKEEPIMKIMKTATEKRIAFRENLRSGHIMIDRKSVV